LNTLAPQSLSLLGEGALEKQSLPRGLLHNFLAISGCSVAEGKDAKELATNHNLLDFLTNLAYITAFSKLHHKKTAIFTVAAHSAVCHTWRSNLRLAGWIKLPVISVPAGKPQCPYFPPLRTKRECH
jgi:hypothetical protein